MRLFLLKRLEWEVLNCFFFSFRILVLMLVKGMYRLNVYFVVYVYGYICIIFNYINLIEIFIRLLIFVWMFIVYGLFNKLLRFK